MKKLAIVASSAALAAMPVVGVFAEDVTTQTDTLSVTISPVCSFGFTDSEDPHVIDVASPSHTNGTAGAGPATWSGNTLSATMLNGTTNSDFGKTTLRVYCNNTDGYQITTNGKTGAVTTVGALTAATAGNNDTIPVNNAFSASSTGWSYQVAGATGNTGIVASAHDGTWATAANAEGTIVNAPSTGTKTTDNSGDTFTITYGVGIDQTLSADTYSGSITYTLVQL